MDAAGVPVEFSKGEAGYGQHEINLVYAEALEMADRGADLQERGEGDRRPARAGRHVHGEVDRRRRRLVVPHPLERVGPRGRRPASMWDDEGEHHLSTVFRHWLGGLVAASRELSLLFAPNVNSYKRFQPDSWAPTAVAWGLDNRTCGLRLVGHGARLPGRVPHPRRRLQPVPRLRRHHRRRPPRHRRGPRPRASPSSATRYADPDVPAHPVDPRRGHRPVRGQRRRPRRVRRGGPAPPRQHRPPGAGRVRPGRHRLGAPPLLRTAVVVTLTMEPR